MEFTVLGPIEAIGETGLGIDLGGARQRRLLAALLAHANRPVATDTLIEIVFDADPPSGATTTIRSYVARLRRALDRSDGGDGTSVATVPGGYRLDVDPSLIDAERFVIALADGRRLLAERAPVAAADTLRDALGLWRGRPYDEVADEEWVRGEVARLEELRVDAEEQLVDAQLACGLTDDVIPELVRLTAEHPLRERCRGQLALALHRAGRHAEAIRALDEYRHELVELGLEPTERLVALERSIAAHDPALRLASPAGSPLRGYRIGSSLGVGRQGEVFRAVQPVVGREVAIKVITPDVADDPEFVRRFDAEAHRVSKLEHAHVVPLYDYWREPNAAYMVMRLLPMSLGRRLDAGPLTIDEGVRMVRQLGSALDAAHRAGLVHGDLRPSNVLIDDDGEFFISDLGLAAHHLRIAPASPPEGMALLAPEIRGGDTPTDRTDQFGLAVLTATSLVGPMPFGTEGIRSADDRMNRLHTQRPAIPSGVDDVLDRATAWDPADRFDSVAELAEDLASALGGQRVRVEAPIVNPYRGLAAFSEADATWFCGRDEAIDEALDRLHRGTRLVTVVGASGSGKSSLVRAGVIPRVRAGELPGSDGWLIATMIPGRRPMLDLANAIRGIATGHLPPVERATVGEMLSPTARKTPVLFVIDQLEELYTVGEPADRDRFIEELSDVLTDPGSDVRVIATLRADFHDRPLTHSRFGRLVADGQVTLVGMTGHDLDLAIREPAGRAGIEVEPGLVAELIADLVDRPAALPLLQFTLSELFDRRRGSVLTLDAYERLGGVRAALARRAEEVYAALDEASREQARQVFLSLVAVGPDGAVIRRRVLRRNLADTGVAPWLEAFGAARLLTFDRDGTTREPTVELAHESLMDEWPRLRRWVLEAGEGLFIRSHLATSATHWATGGKDPGDLYRGARLATALAWQDDDDRPLTSVEQEFLDAGVAAREEIEAAERSRSDERTRAHRRTRALAAMVGVALVLALGAGFVAVEQRNDARAAAARAEAWQLLGAAQATTELDPALSATLAIEAAKRADAEMHDEIAAVLRAALVAAGVVVDPSDGLEELVATALRVSVRPLTPSDCARFLDADCP